MRRTDNYAGNQVRIVLSELQGTVHKKKLKSIEAFKGYLQTYLPTVLPDTVDNLYTACGDNNGTVPVGRGLFYWCGALSEKRSGQLKRVGGPALLLLHWLVLQPATSEEENAFYEGFVRSSLQQLQLLHLELHIAAVGNSNGVGRGTVRRLGVRRQLATAADGVTEEDACELINILSEDHRNSDGKREPLDLLQLLNGDSAAVEKFLQWKDEASDDKLSELRQNSRAAALDERTVDRPTTWSDLMAAGGFKTVPLQEGEDDCSELLVEEEQDNTVLDPLGIATHDLRSTQRLYASGRLYRDNGALYARRTIANYAPVLIGDSTENSSNIKSSNDGGMRGPGGLASLGRRSLITASGRRSSSGKWLAGRVEVDVQRSDSDDSAESDSDDNDTDNGADENDAATTTATAEVAEVTDSGNSSGKRGKVVASIVPSDKAFSAVAFLSVVHGATAFPQLRQGLEHLTAHIRKQSGRREGLVRLHFGLFVQCAEGLDWLKLYRKGVKKPHNGNGARERRNSMRASVAATASTSCATATFSGGGSSSVDKGMEKLKNSQATLNAAKAEAQRTLAPILERMKQSRRIRSAEKVLRRSAGLLELPSRMQAALERGDFEEAVLLYERVRSLPAGLAAASKILQRVRDTANSVAGELKQQLLAQLLAPDADHAKLCRLGKVFFDLEGGSSTSSSAYAELMRMCFLRQVLHFTLLLRESRDAFCAACADANDKGTEQNLMQRSPFLFSGGATNSEAAATATTAATADFDGGGESATAAVIAAVAFASTLLRKQSGSGRELLQGTADRSSAAAARRPQQQRRSHRTQQRGSVSDESDGVSSSDQRLRSTSLELLWDENDVATGSMSLRAVAENGVETAVRNEFEGDSSDDDGTPLRSRGMRVLHDDFFIGSGATSTAAAAAALSRENDDDDTDLDWKQQQMDENDDIVGDASDVFDFLEGHQAKPVATKRKIASDENQQQVGDPAHRVLNYSALLCAAVRQRYLEQLVDLLAKWFPCLFRLVSVLSACERFGVTGVPSPSGGNNSSAFKSIGINRVLLPATAGADGTGSSNGSYVKLNRGALSPVRVLGAVLRLYRDSVTEIVSGLTSGFSELLLPPELHSAFNELDAYSSTSAASASAAMAAVTSISNTVSALSCSLRYENKSYDALVSRLLNRQLREPFYFDALQAIFELYNVIEDILKRDQQKEHEAIASPLLLDSRQSQHQQPVGASKVPFTISSHNAYPQIASSSSAASNKISSPHYLAPASPYFDCMSTLLRMAKECEVVAASSIMDRLMLLTYRRCDFERPQQTSFGSGTGGSCSTAKRPTAAAAVLNPNSSSDNRQPFLGMGGDNENFYCRMECAVRDFHDLLQSCFSHLQSRIRRADWVGEVVQQGIRHSVSAFVEAMRRESIRIELARSSHTAVVSVTSMAVTNASSTAQQQKRSSITSKTATTSAGGVAMRGSIGRGRNSLLAAAVGSSGRRSSAGGEYALLLESLEEDMSVAASDADKSRAAVHLDLLRACLLLRCTLAPSVCKAISTLFPSTTDSAASEVPFSLQLQHLPPAIAHDSDASGIGRIMPTTFPRNESTAGGGGLLRRTSSAFLKNMGRQHSISSATATVSAQAVGTSAAPGRHGIQRMNSSLLIKLFSPTAQHTDETLVQQQMKASDRNQRDNSGSDDSDCGDTSLESMLLRAVDRVDVALLSGSLQDVVDMEIKAASMYVGLKSTELRTAIFAAYALMRQRELQQQQQQVAGAGSSSRRHTSDKSPVAFPVHLSRVLLTLSHEKVTLGQSLANMTVEAGCETAVPTAATVATGAAGGEDSATSFSSMMASLLGSISIDVRDGNGGSSSYARSAPVAVDSFDENESNNLQQKPQQQQRVLPQVRYRGYLYKQLCVGLLDTYKELIVKLVQNSLLPNLSASESASADLAAYSRSSSHNTAAAPVVRKFPNSAAAGRAGQAGYGNSGHYHSDLSMVYVHNNDEFGDFGRDNPISGTSAATAADGDAADSSSFGGSGRDTRSRSAPRQQRGGAVSSSNSAISGTNGSRSACTSPQHQSPADDAVVASAALRGDGLIGRYSMRRPSAVISAANERLAAAVVTPTMQPPDPALVTSQPAGAVAVATPFSEAAALAGNYNEAYAGSAAGASELAAVSPPSIPLTLGQAAEELKFLLIMLRPLVDNEHLTTSFEAISSAQKLLQPGAAGHLYASAKDLETSAKLFSVLLSKGD